MDDFSEQTLNNRFWREYFPNSGDESKDVLANIEKQRKLAAAEARPSYLEGVVQRAVDVATSEIDTPRENRSAKFRHYQHALAGDPSFIHELDAMMDKAYVDDIIELYFMAAGSYSMFPLFNHCKDMMADPAQQPKAATILQHLAPIAAKRQPAILLTFPNLLTKPMADGERPLSLERTEALLLKAVERSDGKSLPANSFQRSLPGAADAETRAMYDRVMEQAKATEAARTR